MSGDGSIFGFDPLAFWIVAICALVNVSCALLGTFLVLRRMSLLGDAISHAVLPGLAIAFIVTQSRSALPMFAGALIAGLLTAVLSQFTARLARVHEDAALGVVFTTFFALGVVLISRVASSVDLDANCVLYGSVETAAWVSQPFLGVDVPPVALRLATVLLLSAVFVALFWKELKIASFDPQLATTLGFNAQLIHYLLMALVAAVTVVAFEAVGSILVVAMLIAPAATALVLTQRLLSAVLLACLIGAGEALAGRGLAAHFNASVAGTMSFLALLVFLAAALLAPQRGALWMLLQRPRIRLRIACEDVLALLWRAEELQPGGTPQGLPRKDIHAALGNRLTTRLGLWLAERRGQAEWNAGRLKLTDAGRAEARSLVIGHRLWESYLHQVMGLPLDHVHDPAERMEHFIDPALRATLSDTLPDAGTDPHGRRIPGSR